VSTVLVTGASGFVGRALAHSLAERHDVVCMSRRAPGLELATVRGAFWSFEDLGHLDRFRFDAAVHLAAVTGGCSERDGMLVNVEGTRCLMRYLIDRGCRKFVLASSIAAVGMQSTQFRPLRVPMADEHPCLDRDGYGFSKYMMEELTRYYARQNADLDVTNLRLASVVPDGQAPPPGGAGPLTEWALGSITVMVLSDAVHAFSLAVEAVLKPGVRVMNACGPRAWVRDPVPDVLRGWYGEDLDLSWYERPGHAYDSVYDVRRVAHEIGFVARVLPNDAHPGSQPEG
jgi:nucleoside-diphosphate-sugar epimerase